MHRAEDGRGAGYGEPTEAEDGLDEDSIYAVVDDFVDELQRGGLVSEERAERGIHEDDAEGSAMWYSLYHQRSVPSSSSAQVSSYEDNIKVQSMPDKQMDDHGRDDKGSDRTEDGDYVLRQGMLVSRDRWDKLDTYVIKDAESSASDEESDEDESDLSADDEDEDEGLFSSTHESKDKWQRDWNAEWQAYGLSRIYTT